MQQHGSNILPEDTPSTPGAGSKGQNIFSESSLAAYQIKENGAYTHPWPLGWDQNGHIISF